MNEFCSGDSHYGVIAQLVERVLSMHEALGSTPSNSIFLILRFGSTQAPNNLLLYDNTVYDRLLLNKFKNNQQIRRVCFLF
jgi:hypothetical protein